MVYIRTLKSLSSATGERIEAGQIIECPWKAADALRLMDAGAIAEIIAPPLYEFPGWERRGQTLHDMGFTSVQIFLSTDSRIIGKAVKRKTKTVDSWKAEIIQLLKPPARKGGG